MGPKSLPAGTWSRLMIRCRIDSVKWPDRSIALSGGEAHHLLRVLRAQIGDVVTVFDGQGREAVAKLVDVEKGRAVLHVAAVSESPPSRIAVVLVQALIREQKMDVIIRQATELGVSGIVPVATERSVVRLDSRARSAKRERWQRIAESAAKQCATPWIPEIGRIVDYPEMLKESDGYDLFLVGALRTGAEPLGELLRRAKTAGPVRIGFLIGPEGDLTPDELAAAEAAGAIAVTLGATVLRAETAAVYVLSILKHEFPW